RDQAGPGRRHARPTEPGAVSPAAADRPAAARAGRVAPAGARRRRRGVPQPARRNPAALLSPMRILWAYLRPHGRLAVLALVLAAASQVLALIDQIIFGRIIVEYAINRAGKSDDELVSGVLGLLALAVLVAVLSRLAKALQEYVTRLVVQKFGTQLFNDGLRQALRLKFQELEDLRSGETLSLLQKVRADSGRFMNAFIITVFTALVGMGFLVWYAVTRHWLLVPVFLIGVLVLGGLTGLL